MEWGCKRAPVDPLVLVATTTISKQAKNVFTTSFRVGDGSGFGPQETTQCFVVGIPIRPLCQNDRLLCELLKHPHTIVFARACLSKWHALAHALRHCVGELFFAGGVQSP